MFNVYAQNNREGGGGVAKSAGKSQGTVAKVANKFRSAASGVAKRVRTLFGNTGGRQANR